MVIPQIIESDSKGFHAMDIFSQLHKHRNIILGSQVTDESANLIIAQLLQLEYEDPDRDIILYINSPGGSVSAGLAIHDTMKYIKCDVCTIAMGMAASMGSFLLCSGTKGKRFALPNANIMIHQPLGGMQGQCSDMQIQAAHIQQTREKLESLIAEYSGQDIDYVHTACDRDNYLTAEQAKEFGLIDDIMYKR